MTDVEDLERKADEAAASGDLAGARRSLEQAVAGDSANVAVWTKLTMIRRALGDMKGALAAVERALALSPLDFSNLLVRAMLLERLGNPGADAAFRIAIAQLPSGELPVQMAAAIEHARSRAAAHEAAVEQRLLAALPSDGLDSVERARLERFVTNTSRRTRHFHQEPTDFHYPALPEIEFHDVDQFEGVEQLEAATDTIRAEYEALVKLSSAELVPYTQYPDHVPLAQWRELNNNRDWTAIHLLQNGNPIQANAAHCPATIEALSKLPQPTIPNAAPNAMFSLLAPKTRIPPHTGVANVRLVAHLPLIVPDGCGFRVGGTTRQWEVGKLFVFDDTIEHEAWNDSDDLRVVLIFDLWAPALSQPERKAVARMIGAAGVSFNGA